ncbi:T9SS type A sorting domain-containing protein [Raineya orbicola]|uniref:Por secretion system C-terminal sorting domain n=1 Tax=Raineya orbicola TaxID=2016530 RepID=A0A2N3IIA0_9BACT|nr:T9SS type A sorting domain-containing protein [Raineya orbicola]PKQ69953.1 Por secretion system C-terminal sorting domain [Raineya orbicola]
MKKSHFLFVLLLLSFTFSKAQTIYVSPTGNDTNAGTSCTDAKQTLSAAIAAAPAGGTVFVCTGSYTITSNVVINKPLTLLGDTPQPIFTMSGACESILVVASPNVTIQNLHLRVNGAGGTSTNGRHGIFVANHGVPGAYNNLQIIGNTIENINPAPMSVDMHAYAIRFADNNIISFLVGNNQVTIQNNTIPGNPAAFAFFRVGIRSIGNYGTITNNNIQGGGLYAIQWGDLTGNVNITSNNISAIAQAGVEINIPVATATVNINNNNLSVPAFVPDASSFAVIEIKDNYLGSVVNIQNNTISGHPNVGIWLGRSRNVNIISNTFTPRLTSTTFNHLIINTKNRTFSVSAGSPLTVQNISILDNTFHHSTSVGGTAIAFANHHSGAVPAFNNITIGSATQRNRFHANIARFIALDPFYGNTDAVVLTLPLGAFPNPFTSIWTTGMPSTTMASVNTNFNAVNNEFDVGSGLQTPLSMSNPDLILLENRIQHAIDYGALGFVTVKPNHVFVTQQSFIAPAFTTSPRIRRGTNVISADGFTLNVEQGSYTDDGSATDRPLTTYNTDFVPVGAMPVISENWELNGTGKTLNMLGDLTINNQMIFTDGFVQTNTNTLYFSPTAIDPAVNPTTVGEKNNSRILGRARTIRNVGTGAFDFLGLNLPAGADIGTLDLLRVSDAAGIQTVGTFTSIACTWYIQPSVANGRNGVEFRWLPAINNGKNTNQLQVWRNNGTVWEIRSTPFIAPSTSPLITSIPINVTAFSPWTISDIVNPLPVEFLSIQARYNENHIPEILWNTMSEINADFYEVERSFDAKDFVKIVQISAKKKSENRYVVEDRGLGNKITGKIYYRIKQVDKDGKFTYSRIVSLSTEKSNLLAGIYPNPTRDILYLNSLQERLEVKIQDLYGRTLQVIDVKFGENQINFSHMPQGVYWIEVKGASLRELYKIVRN